MLKGGRDAEDPELTEDAAERQVRVAGALQGHHPRELPFADQTLLGGSWNAGSLDATTCRGWGGAGASVLGLRAHTRPQAPLLLAARSVVTVNAPTPVSFPSEVPSPGCCPHRGSCPA